MEVIKSISYDQVEIIKKYFITSFNELLSIYKLDLVLGGNKCHRVILFIQKYKLMENG